MQTKFGVVEEWMHPLRRSDLKCNLIFLRFSSILASLATFNPRALNPKMAGIRNVSDNLTALLNGKDRKPLVVANIWWTNKVNKILFMEKVNKSELREKMNFRDLRTSREIRTYENSNFAPKIKIRKLLWFFWWFT